MCVSVELNEKSLVVGFIKTFLLFLVHQHQKIANVKKKKTKEKEENVCSLTPLTRRRHHSLWVTKQGKI